MKKLKRKSTTTMMFMILTGMFLIAGCKKDNLFNGKDPEYPMEISFTEYCLSETCRWTNLAFDNTVIIINNDEELERYVTCKNGDYPIIDFSKHSLLVANGKTDNGIFKITVSSLRQFSENEYELSMEILLDGTEVYQLWAVAIMVEKVNKKSNVKLNISCNEAEYPIEIPYIEYSELLTANRNWKNLDYGNVILINNREQLEYYAYGRFPNVDFSKHSLLLVSGSVEDGGISGITKKLQRLSTNEYELEVELVINPAKQDKEWVLALIVEKMNEESSFKLTVTTSYEEPEITLQGTTWKLVGFVDVETGEIKEAEPKDCNTCFTLTFDTDSTFFGFSSTNELIGSYLVDYETHEFQIIHYGGTKLGEVGDGYIYSDILYDVRSFFMKNNELLLYYNEKNNYLFFKLQKP